AALRSDEGPTSRDIDNEVESAVKAINGAKIDTVAAKDILSGGWGEAGAMVYIMDLEPLYELIGSRKGRLVAALRETCDTVFSQDVALGQGRASFRGDQFFMRFINTDKTEGFRQAATIINEIGTRIFGDRFQPMQIPGLLVVADAGDITNADGSLDSEKTAAVVQSGGLSVAMDKPGTDAPGWLTMRWNSTFGGGAPSADLSEPSISEEPDPIAIPEWLEQAQQTRAASQWKKRGSDRRKRTSGNYMNGEKRKSWLGRRTVDNIEQIVW
ncbi:MAG: hypothetical protein QF639_04940, partial [Rhodospirillales bacterium]|nr:hypothetical protein [Rhodospirillales bacterium]